MPLTVLTVLLPRLGPGHYSACWVYIQGWRKQAVSLPSRSSERMGMDPKCQVCYIHCKSSNVSILVGPPPSIFAFTSAWNWLRLQVHFFSIRGLVTNKWLEKRNEKVDIQNTSLCLFIIRMKRPKLILLNCYKSFCSYSQFLKFSPCIPYSAYHTLRSSEWAGLILGSSWAPGLICCISKLENGHCPSLAGVPPPWRSREPEAQADHSFVLNLPLSPGAL